MLSPVADQRPGLRMVQMTLEDEQAELAADLAEAEAEDSDAPAVAAAGPPAVAPLPIEDGPGIAATMTRPRHAHPAACLAGRRFF